MILYAAENATQVALDAIQILGKITVFIRLTALGAY